METIQFVSLATGKKATLPADAVSAQEVAFLRSAIRAGGAELAVPNVELVVERPHEPGDPGKIEDGALIYFLRHPGSDGLVAGAMVCWAEDYSAHAWAFAQCMQSNSDVVGLAQGELPPPVPWVAGFCTGEYAEMTPGERRQIADLDVALAWACV